MRIRENKNECTHMLFRLVNVATMFVLFVCTRWLLCGLPECLWLKPARIPFSPLAKHHAAARQVGTNHGFVSWAQGPAQVHG